jgi:DNA-binding winged helix-turn-helix (wHTH) protein
MTGDPTRRVFSFGAFEADPVSGELRKHGLRVKLHAQPFQVLVMLLERPSELVTRDDLRQRLWGSDIFIDFDHGLNSAVNKIREALNDSASRPVYIETVPGRGYRFIAPVSSSNTSLPAGAAATSGVVPTPNRDREGAGSPSVLSTVDDLPAPPRKIVRTLILMVQILYLGIYLTALANLREVDDLLRESALPPVLLTVIVAAASILIPVRLYLAAAAAFDLRHLPAKFARLFPILLLLDLLWSLSPFLLSHYISAGFALGLTAILVYLPFAQRSLILMYGREPN